MYVKHLVPGSKAEECARLHIGDRLLEVNGFDLRHSNVDDAASFISVCVCVCVCMCMCMRVCACECVWGLYQELMYGGFVN